MFVYKIVFKVALSMHLHFLFVFSLTRFSSQKCSALQHL